MKRHRVADCGKPEETCLTLMAQALERRHNVIDHLVDTERFFATGFLRSFISIAIGGAIIASVSAALGAVS